MIWQLLAVAALVTVPCTVLTVLVRRAIRAADRLTDATLARAESGPDLLASTIPGDDPGAIDHPRPLGPGVN